MRFRPSLFAIPPALAGLQTWRTYDRLPDRVAAHFDFVGRPDGWASRPAFFAFYFGLLGLLIALFSGSVLLLRRVPPGLINLPNRDYWLAPERRDATMDDLSARVSHVGLASMLFIVGTYELGLRANLGSGVLSTTPLWVGLGLLVVLFVVWLILGYRRYRVPA